MIRVGILGIGFMGMTHFKAWKSVKGAKDTGWNNGFLAFAAEIVECLKQGKTIVENAATFEDGYKIQLLLDAARESNEKGAVVKL